MSSLVLTVTSEDSQAVLQQLYEKSSNNVKEELKGLEILMRKLQGGQARGTVHVQSGSSSPVAASGTWTLATVIATDEADVGGVAFTFTASPTLETDVLVTVASAKAFASSTDLTYGGVITESTHGYKTGDVGRLTTSSSLPGGFALSTDYHVIRVDADSYKLASSRANALAGVGIFPSSLGVGNQTFTPTADKCTASRLEIAVNAHSTLQYVVTALAAAAVVTVSAKQKGLVGNFIPFTDQDSTITSSGSGYLAGGTGGAADVGVVYACGL